MILGIKWLTLLLSPSILVIILTSVVSVAAILDRSFHFINLRFNYEVFLRKLKIFIDKKEVEKAIEFCNSYRYPVSRVVEEGLKNAYSPRDCISSALEKRQLEERGILENHIGILSTISFIAPLLGLLGTVIGIIRAFSGMVKAGGGSPTVMMAGIAIALITTAAGISVAVPAALAFGVFSGKVDSITGRMKEASKYLMQLMSQNKLINTEEKHGMRKEKPKKEPPQSASQTLCDALTPGMNVALLLILFFMMFAPLMYESNITVSAPALAKAATEQKEDKTELKLNIHIAADNTVYINNEKMPADTGVQNQLMRELLKRSLQRIAIISADEELYHYVVVDMIDRATQCGAEKICILKRKKG